MSSAEAVMTNTARLELPDQSLDLPVVTGAEGEKAVDVSALRAKTGYITLDEGYRNTGSCQSNITFIDGEKGILRYRGVPIEEVAQKCTFTEACWLVIHGDLPTADQAARFRALMAEHAGIHEGLRQVVRTLPPNGHPMAILSSMINSLSCYHPNLLKMETPEDFEEASARLLSKVRTVTAATYKSSIGQAIQYPMPGYGYSENFLHMMFSEPNKPYEIDDDVVKALNFILILHADHEQNCSTSTVRMVASSGANLFASCSAGVCALWGPLHGGANVAVMNQLNEIHKSGINVAEFVEHLKETKGKLFGFGHAVYRNFDPRAKILGGIAETLLKKLNVNDPLLNIARQLEEAALSDQYFIDRKLYPNVDFYSGILLRAIGIPVDMFTVMFAMGRMPGWIANYKEVLEGSGRIYRPRQVYQGPAQRSLGPTES